MAGRATNSCPKSSPDCSAIYRQPEAGSRHDMRRRSNRQTDSPRRPGRFEKKISKFREKMAWVSRGPPYSKAWAAPDGIINRSGPSSILTRIGQPPHFFSAKGEEERVRSWRTRRAQYAYTRTVVSAAWGNLAVIQSNGRSQTKTHGWPELGMCSTNPCE